MDFELTPEQVAYRRSVETFARVELNDDVTGRDARHEFDPTAWKKCAEFGLQGLCVPHAYGGGGADPLTIALALEALGHGCADSGLIFSLNAQMWSAEMPIVRFGSEEQRLRYLPGLCDGSLIGVQGMTEPDTGSDAFAVRTTAVPDRTGWRLSGRKTFITNAPVADVFVVFASTDRALGFAGLSAFLVERDAPGLTVGEPFRKMGLRTSPMSELVFEDCHVGGAALLGRPGSGMAIFNSSMDWERSFILAAGVGTMQRQVEQCVEYANGRRQFGQSIGKFQAVSHRIVQMQLRLETSRLMLYRLAWLKATGRSTARDAALVKLHLSESLVASSLDALQVHAGYGYMEESGVERDVRDALGSRIYSGTSDIQRNLVAAQLGL